MNWRKAARRAAGIISLFLFLIVGFQSCMVGLGNSLFSSGEVSGVLGILLAFLFMVTGVVMTVASKSESMIPSIICAAVLWFGYFIAKMGYGSYSDLKVWGFFAFVIGVVYLVSAVKTRKGYIIVGAVSLVYLIAALL